MSEERRGDSAMPESIRLANARICVGNARAVVQRETETGTMSQATRHALSLLIEAMTDVLDHHHEEKERAETRSSRPRAMTDVLDHHHEEKERAETRSSRPRAMKVPLDEYGRPQRSAWPPGQP